MEITNEVLETREGSASELGDLTIKYSTELSKAPYTIDVNYLGMKRVLEDFGIGPKEAGKTEVDVLRRQPVDRFDINSVREKILGRYTHYSNKVEIYADNVWETYESLIETCNEVLEGSKDPHVIDKFKRDGVIITGRLPDYLAAAPPERARKFVEKLALTGFERMMKQGLLHEAAHKFYDVHKPATRLFLNPLVEKGLPLVFFSAPLLGLWAGLTNGRSPWLVAPAMVSAWFMYNLGQHFGYKFSPEEIKARKLSERFAAYPNLVRVKRK
jgi:hypothetical protein